MLQGVHVPCIKELVYDRKTIYTNPEQFPFSLKSSENLSSISINFVFDDESFGGTMDHIAKWTDPARCQSGKLTRLELWDIDTRICADSLRHMVNLEELALTNSLSTPIESGIGTSLLAPFRHLTRSANIFAFMHFVLSSSLG